MFPFSRHDLQIPKQWLSGSQCVEVAFHSAHKGGLNQVFNLPRLKLFFILAIFPATIKTI